MSEIESLKLVLRCLYIQLLKNTTAFISNEVSCLTRARRPINKRHRYVMDYFCKSKRYTFRRGALCYGSIVR